MPTHTHTDNQPFACNLPFYANKNSVTPQRRLNENFILCLCVHCTLCIDSLLFGSSFSNRISKERERENHHRERLRSFAIYIYNDRAERVNEKLCNLVAHFQICPKENERERKRGHTSLDGHWPIVVMQRLCVLTALWPRIRFSITINRSFILHFTLVSFS